MGDTAQMIEQATPSQPGQMPGFYCFNRATGAVESNRLVKASKCPTKNINQLETIETAGTCMVLSYRAWSDEWRVTCRTDAPYQLPPQQAGRRETDTLSQRGARKISESCEYVALTQGGYRTFLTLTFDMEARARMLDHQAIADFTKIKLTREGYQPIKTYTDGFERTLSGNSLQRELSRFFDGLQKIYQRGFKTHYQRGYIRRRKTGDYIPVTFNKQTQPGNDNALSYCWVAECPQNAQGKPNPHVHVLLAWEIDYSVFPIWAQRIEKLWRQGFAHLEKIKSRGRKSASAYIAKAAKYISKGEGQGTIKGNRYGISKPARAPGWEAVRNYAWHKMGAIIEKTRLIHKNKTAPARKARDRATWVYENSKGKGKRRAFEILKTKRRQLEQSQNGLYFTRCSVTAQGWDAMNRFMEYADRAGWIGLKRPPSIYFAALKRKAEQAAAMLREREAVNSPEEYWQALLSEAEQFEPAFIH